MITNMHNIGIPIASNSAQNADITTPISNITILSNNVIIKTSFKIVFTSL